MPSTSCPGATTGRPGGDSGSDFSTSGWRAISRRIPSRGEFPPMPAYTPPAARRPWRPAPLIRGSVALHLAAAGAALARPQWWPGALSVLVADHVLLGAVGLWPRSKLLGPNWTRLPEAGAGGAAAIAITFDDGPDPDVTPRVLALLDERSEEHTSELQSHSDLVCRLLLEKKKITKTNAWTILSSTSPQQHTNRANAAT